MEQGDEPGRVRGLLDDPNAIREYENEQAQEAEAKEAERKAREAKEEKEQKKQEKKSQREFMKKEFFQSVERWKWRLIRLIFGPDAQEMDEKLDKPHYIVRWEKNKPKVKLVVAVVFFVTLFFFLWNLAYVLGIVGKIRGIEKTFVNGQEVRNVYIPHRVENDIFQKICKIEKNELTVEDFANGFVEFGFFVGRMNATLESLEVFAFPEECTSSLYGGISVDMMKIGKTIMYNPVIKKESDERMSLKFKDDIGNAVQTKVPSLAIVEFRTNSGKIASKRLSKWDSSCFFGLKEIERECKNS